MKKKILLSVLGLAALAAFGILGTKAVRADEVTFYPPFIERLVERFNLNESEVQTFFEEQREKHHQTMTQKKEERLNQAITDGVITEQQKQALLNKWGELRQEREKHREEMQVWFKEQGLDTEALREYVGFGQRGFGHRLGEPSPNQ